MTRPASSFTVVNGRVVFDNGITKRWRCPVCAWWREWQVESCSACAIWTPARPSSAPWIETVVSSGHARGQKPVGRLL